VNSGSKILLNRLAEKFAELKGKNKAGRVFALLKRDNGLSCNADAIRKFSLRPIILSTQAVTRAFLAR
jgi:hypothetical protein